jgi:D-lactate dehydrogenase (cytochrome)
MSIQSAITTLKDTFGAHLVETKAVRDQHGTNEGYFPVTPPDAVLFPGSTQEVSEAVKICAAHECPIIAYGTGTSLEGHHLAYNGGVTFDMSRMNKLLKVNENDLDCVVQPGITREEVNTELRATGLFFPIDPGANASIGGMTATRASGTTAVRYGTMRENVLALEVVLPDGRIIRTGTRARKSSTGYDLTKLFVGSEGTLGIITEITLRLQGQPEAVSAATCAFEDFEAAVNTVITTIQMGIPMARIEFVDEMMAKGFNIHDPSANLAEVPQLFVEFHGSQQSVKEQAEAFGEIVADMGGAEFKWTDKAEERTALWKLRHNAYYAQKALRPESQVRATDVCVPISRLAEGVQLARIRAEELGLTVSMVGHVGDGNFHCGIAVDSEEERKRADQYVHELNELALKLDGTVSGEHGIGRGKMKYMADEHGDALSLMVDIKRSFDPQNIMNPGKVVPLN